MQQRQVLGKSRFCNFSICEPLEIILAVKFNCRRGGGEGRREQSWLEGKLMNREQTKSRKRAKRRKCEKRKCDRE